MNELITTTFTDEIQYVKVEIGQEHFGIDIGMIDNIVRMQRITRVPNVPSYIKGVINLRGEIVPIMNLRMKMGLEEIEYVKSTRIIIIKTEAYGKIGMIVDAVRNVVNISEEQVEKMRFDSGEENRYVTGVAKVADELISLLDINAILIDKLSREEQ